MNPVTALSQQSVNCESDRQFLCFHTNTTTQIQLIRITNSPNLRLERVVFPGQRLLFEATPEAKLEIKTSEVVTFIVPCTQLRVA